MFIGNTAREFYDVINGSRVLLLVNHDIDGICAAKILQNIFSCGSITYTLVSVEGVADLKRAFEENCDEIKYVVLVNCGGTVDIVELLKPEEHYIFFVVDSHRPTDLCNVYSSSQVRLIGKGSTDDIPEFDDIFKESDSEEEEEEESGNESDPEESRASKRRRLTEEAILKRREKRLWEEKRDRLVFNYSQFSYYGRASALLVFELASSLSKSTTDMLWWAILGLTEQLIMGKIEAQHYVLETGTVQEYVSQLNMSEEDEAVNVCTPRISYIKDFHLALFRHWTIESSLRNSMYSACQLKLWTIRGERKLQELLVEMGLPLVESRKKFMAMDLELRQEFPSAMEKVSKKYDMDRLSYPSFLLQYGYRNKYSAADEIYALISLLESTGREKSAGDCFLETLSALSRSNKKLIAQGVEKAKQVLVGIFKTVQAALEMRMVSSAGPFLYLVIQEGTLNSRMFSHPHTLLLLGQFTLRAYVTIRKSKAIALPLLVSAPLAFEPSMCLVAGVPPVVEDSPRSFFGKAFEQAAEKTNARVDHDFFDSSVVKLHTEDRSKFFDALAALLS